ncbi:MAG: threonine--tRNA ligase [Candidatus Heimdallarchaeota archaeon]|nr:MAG: threonine--tRNA ligase [Candidatus Heimdallarchaeota archaeon]
MQLLLIHSDGFSWKVNDKAVSNAESLSDHILGEYSTIDSVMVIFIGVETVDTDSTSQLIKKSILEIQQALVDVKETNVILYPWVHLAKTTPAKPTDALRILQTLQKQLQSKFPDFHILRAPFGYYKAFSLHCKGHALAERSKEITSEKKETQLRPTVEVITAITAEDEAKSQFFILTQAGKLVPYDSFDYEDLNDFRIFVNYETAKDRTVSSPPKHVALMKQLELIDYEEGSDAGNFRILPRGYVVKHLIENHVLEMAIRYGAMVVETPLMYSYEHPSLKKYLERFPARQYIVKSGEKDYFLRFSACFGQFLTLSDAIISYRQLPLKMFEIANSFRREQRGELAGIRRLRAFTMPDLHTAAMDMQSAKKEFEAQFKLAFQYMRDIEVSFETAFRMTTEFFEENKDWIISLITNLEKPILLELFNTRYAYFILKFEFNIVDGQRKAGALSTVQIDVENSERFNIKYINEQGQEEYPLLLHCSLSGSTERVIYGILEEQIKRMQKGSKPQLPLWLSPAQVRILPVTGEFLSYSEQIAEKLERNKIRVEIDDRDLSLAKKIRAAEKLWIPLIFVIGEDELKQNKINVRYRKENVQELQSLKEVIAYIGKHTAEMPSFYRVIPKLVSHQPIFTREV